MNKWFLAIALGCFVTCCSNLVVAQGGGGGNNNNNNNQAATGGIDIDAEGVLRTLTISDASGKIDNDRMKAAKASLNTDLQKPSQSRKVSLKKLEAAAKAAKANGEPLPDDVKYLAGLTRITNVFFYPDSEEIVIAGPAEGFYLNSQNRPVGLETGAAILQLEDLVVALRAFKPGAKPTSTISVSIDPTVEGSQRVNQVFEQMVANPNNIRGNEAVIAENVRKAMGLQNITIEGVSTKTRFAHVLTEADYRMKLIGMGLEAPPVRITNYVDHMPMVSNSALNRWYFQPKYEGVSINSDGTSMELIGNGIELVAEQDRIRGGEKVQGAKGNKAARNFAASFTKQYEALAARMPLYGELRNLVDLSVAAAFIQKAQLAEKANWNLDYFGNEQQFPTEVYAAPTQVEPVVTAIWKDGAFSTPVGGGVTIQPYAALKSEKMNRDDASKIDDKKNAIKFDNLADGQWWWD